jgi:hypothetical protein
LLKIVWYLIHSLDFLWSHIDKEIVKTCKNLIHSLDFLWSQVDEKIVSDLSNDHRRRVRGWRRRRRSAGTNFFLNNISVKINKNLPSNVYKKISFRIQDNFTRTYFTVYFWTKIKNDFGRTDFQCQIIRTTINSKK